MKVRNMINSKGNTVPNQFIITTTERRYYDSKDEPEVDYTDKTVHFFQSYDSIIAKDDSGEITLDENNWDYSVTTGKYRNMFLGETKKETQAKIDSGEYKLADLN